MEEASLDDFFAKKDKSKKKSKVKSVENEDGSKSTKKEKKKDKSTKMTSLNSSTQERKKPVDDEWNDFEEETAADYSNLRIQTLQQKEDMEKDAEREEEEFDENGEVKERKDGSSGPWNKSNSGNSQSAPIVKEEKQPAPAPVVSNTGRYIPPSQRAAALAQSTGSSGLPTKRGKKELPNIRSDFDFPTLAGMPGAPEPAPQPQSHSHSSIHNTTTSQPKQPGALALDNKFAVLQD